MKSFLPIYIIFTILSFLFAFMLPAIILYSSRSSKPNKALGFSTNRALKSKETWEYANHTAGKLVLIFGFIYLVVVVALLVLILILRNSNIIIPNITIITPIIMCIFPYVYIIPSVQSKLKKLFDSNGKRIED